MTTVTNFAYLISTAKHNRTITSRVSGMMVRPIEKSLAGGTINDGRCPKCDVSINYFRLWVRNECRDSIVFKHIRRIDMERWLFCFFPGFELAGLCECRPSPRNMNIRQWFAYIPKIG